MVIKFQTVVLENGYQAPVVAEPAAEADTDVEATEEPAVETEAQAAASEADGEETTEKA
jgi:hypothetical protein